MEKQNPNPLISFVFKVMTQLFSSPGCSSESVDVHGELLLPLLHGGQSLHWAAQVHKHLGSAVAPFNDHAPTHYGLLRT